MSMLVAFAVGYVVGARGGSEDFDEVVEAIKAILASDEFADFLATLRSHAAHTMREVASMLERSEAADGSVAQDLVERVKALINRS